MKDCRKCRTYKDCPGKPWYNYGDIRWCVYQVFFIIENWATLLAGDWADNPDGSSYIDPLVKTGYKAEAYYTKPEEILGELDYRLKRTGTDGKLLKAQIMAGDDYNDLESESHLALMYVKGKRRKRMSYKDWQNERTYRHSQPV